MNVMLFSVSILKRFTIHINFNVIKFSHLEMKVTEYELQYFDPS